jgi:hypothetical protein
MKQLPSNASIHMQGLEELMKLTVALLADFLCAKYTITEQKYSPRRHNCNTHK